MSLSRFLSGSLWVSQNLSWCHLPVSLSLMADPEPLLSESLVLSAPAACPWAVSVFLRVTLSLCHCISDSASLPQWPHLSLCLLRPCRASVSPTLSLSLCPLEWLPPTQSLRFPRPALLLSHPSPPPPSPPSLCLSWSSRTPTRSRAPAFEPLVSAPAAAGPRRWREGTPMTSPAPLRPPPPFPFNFSNFSFRALLRARRREPCEAAGSV